MAFAIATTRSRGFSMIEILIALGVLVVFLSFAAPSVSQATAKADLRAAAENMQFSIGMAKTTARQLETAVVMQFNTDPNGERHSVTYSFPAKNVMPGSASQLQDVQFPPQIRLVSDAPSVQFDRRGMVRSSVQVVLVSSQDDNLSQRFVIE